MKDLKKNSANDFGLLDLLEKADLVEGENGGKNGTEKSFKERKEFLGDDDVVPSTFVNLKKADVENFDLTIDQENDLKADGNNRKRKSMLKIILLDFFHSRHLTYVFFQIIILIVIGNDIGDRSTLSKKPLESNSKFA